jgi:hypothetical protein
MENTANQCEGIPGRNGGTLRPWPKGVSGNPHGRPKLGLTLVEHYNAIGDAMERGAVTVADVEEMAKSDPNGNRRIAAASYMRMLNTGYFNATPLAANDLDRVMDRTAGKPTQKVEVTHDESDPAELLRQIAAILQRRPDLAQRVVGVLPRDIVAEVTAQPVSVNLPET